MSVKAPSTRARRFVRFRLRTLLVIVTLLSVGLGLYVKKQRDRYLAIEAIRASGGQVEFQPLLVDESESRERALAAVQAYRSGRPRPIYAAEEPQGAPWQRRMFGKYGKYYGSSVYRIELGKSMFSPADAVIDVDVLAPLGELKRLILGAPIDDAMLQRLPRLPELERLQLNADTNVTDGGLACLARLPKLENLQITGGNFTATGMANIGAARNLSSLMLTDCELTDDSLAALAGLENLETLWLHGCTISDRAVVHLARLRGLKQLWIADTNITQTGVRKLQRALPDCMIDSSYP